MSTRSSNAATTAVPTAVHTDPVILGALGLPPGVSASLHYKGQAQNINPNTGEVEKGHELKGGNAIIELNVASSNVRAFVALPDQQVDGKTVKCHCSPIEPVRHDGNSDVYVREVPLQYFKPKDWYYTKPPGNNVRVVEVGEDGRVCLWEITVVFQNGVPFFVAQRTWKVQAYQHEGQVLLPELSNWNTLTTFMGTFVDITTLPPVTERTWQKEVIPDLPEGVVLVKHFAISTGTGGGICKGGAEVKLYFGEIDRRSHHRLAFLLTGEVIEYQTKKSPPEGSTWAFEAGNITLATGDLQEAAIQAIKAARAAQAAPAPAK
jgi:hypothetical protein